MFQYCNYCLLTVSSINTWKTLPISTNVTILAEVRHSNHRVSWRTGNFSLHLNVRTICGDHQLGSLPRDKAADASVKPLTSIYWWSYTSSPTYSLMSYTGSTLLFTSLTGARIGCDIHHSFTTHNNSQTSYTDLKLPPLNSCGSYNKTRPYRKLKLSEPWSGSSFTAKIQIFARKPGTCKPFGKPRWTEEDNVTNLYKYMKIGYDWQLQPSRQRIKIS
jgi:hypothetical protein